MRLAPVAVERVVVSLLWIMAASTVGVLLFIIGWILAHGLLHVSWEYLSESPEKMGREGGILPMIVASGFVAGLAVLLAAPIGVATAIYLTEYTREGRATAVIRFGADCLAG
ncbi:MAG TPA: phosphate ABC transporter, permease protein PstA, partial [Phycisphaerae bacterium]|nr:phosphate ABC transporter, permease protein PstA [Phycisphaerae bacterium]